MALAAAGACGLTPVIAQRNIVGGRIAVEGEGSVWNFEADTLTLRNVVLRQEDGTLISARETRAFGIADNFRNTRWELRDTVHIEYRDTRLDADSAIVTYANGSLQSIQVRGAPAHFAHVTGETSRRSEGRANAIDFDSVARKVKLSGNGWFQYGDNEARTDTLYYSLDDRVLSTDEGVKLNIVIPERRIAPPRAPDRSTAQ